MRVARATSGLLRCSFAQSRYGLDAWRQPTSGFSSAAQNAAEEEFESQPVSWFQKIKGMFRGKQEQPKQAQEEHAGPKIAQGGATDAELGETFTMIGSLHERVILMVESQQLVWSDGTLLRGSRLQCVTCLVSQILQTN